MSLARPLTKFSTAAIEGLTIKWFCLYDLYFICANSSQFHSNRFQFRIHTLLKLF